MLTDITAKYVDTLIREGKNFDYLKWFRSVQEEQVQAKQIPAAFPSGKPVAPEIDSPAITSDRKEASANSVSSVTNKTAPIVRMVFGSEHETKSEPPKARLKRRLVKVRYAWNEFQATRARDSVYKYLEAVFSIVEHYKGQRKANRLLRQAFNCAGHELHKNKDLFSAVIRCTCDDTVDNKTISKFSRALRYASYSDVPAARLKAFMKEAGGVNACADRYARYYGRGSR